MPSFIHVTARGPSPALQIVLALQGSQLAAHDQQVLLTWSVAQCTASLPLGVCLCSSEPMLPPVWRHLAWSLSQPGSSDDDDDDDFMVVVGCWRQLVSMLGSRKICWLTHEDQHCISDEHHLCYPVNAASSSGVCAVPGEGYTGAGDAQVWHQGVQQAATQACQVVVQ